MDPNETLREIRKIIADWHHGYEGDVDSMLELSAYFGALDAWLSRGGFKPADWDMP